MSAFGNLRLSKYEVVDQKYETSWVGLNPTLPVWKLHILINLFILKG